MNPKFGWYSAKMAEIAGTVVYNLVDSNKQVTLTCVSSTGDHGTKWDDIKFIGIVDGFVCRSRKAIMDMDFDNSDMFAFIINYIEMSKEIQRRLGAPDSL